MFDVSKKDIHLAQFADHKQHAIAQVAQALINAGYVMPDYLTGMQKRENQASTYLGNGIAIPHGTVETRHNVLQTGVQVFQFPQGVDWDDGQKAYIVIGIAAKSEEHLSLLRQLTYILSDENIAKEMATSKSIDSIYNILLAKEPIDDFIFKASMISLDVDTSHIMTLQALNINHLQDANAINNDFIVDVITNPPLYLGQGIWLSDSKKGNLKTAMAIARPKKPLSYQDHQLCLLITLSCKDNRANNTLNHLANLLIDKKTAKLLQTPDAVQMFTLLTTNTNEEKGTLSAEFTLNNKHGLHARPSSQLVNTIKKFNSKVTITNLDGNGIPANGHNIMSVIGLVARQNDRLQFKISGPDAQATLYAIEQVINANMDEKNCMKGKVATITLNPAYDLVGMLDKIEKGAINLVKTHGLYPAGKGINVANTLKNLNVNVTAGGFLGKENLNGFLHDFKQRGITNRFHVIEGRTRINVKLTEINSVVSDFNFSGFEVNKQDWQHFARDSLSWLSQFDMVCVSGSLPKGIDLDDFTNWMKQLRKQCMCVIFDSSREALIAGLKANPWLVKPNRHELESWIGHPLPTYQAIAKAAQQLRSQGIAHVVISLGEEGAMWVNASGAWLATPPKCQVVSTVGAGDAMVGGLIYGLMMRQTSEHTLRLATAISAITVSQGNVRNMDRQQLTKMMNQVALIPFQI